jgi:hypothetical protein
LDHAGVGGGFVDVGVELGVGAVVPVIGVGAEIGVTRVVVDVGVVAVRHWSWYWS